MRQSIVLCICFLSLCFGAPTARADYYQYNVICIPTQIGHVARALQGRIYLALKKDPSIAKYSVNVSVRKLPEVVEQRTDAELLNGLGYSFDTHDLSLSLGGSADGAGCFAYGTITVRISVTRKDGTAASNQFTTPVLLPGAYATKAKTRVHE